MPNNQPRLDRSSLAQLGRELRATHHTSEKEPLSDRQKDLLLEWAVKEALEAAQHEAVSQAPSQPSSTLLPLPPPEAPRPIATAPRASDERERPLVLLLYAPDQGGWHTGFWSMGKWRTHLSAEADLRPTHWLPPMLGPEKAAGQDPEEAQSTTPSAPPPFT